MEISNNSSTGSGGVGLKEREGAIKQLSTEKVLTPMLKGDFETPCQQGSDAVKSGLPPTALAQVWSRLKAQCGEFVKAKKPRVMQVDLKYIACLIPIVFTSKAKLDLRLVFYVEGNARIVFVLRKLYLANTISKSVPIFLKVLSRWRVSCLCHTRNRSNNRTRREQSHQDHYQQI